MSAVFRRCRRAFLQASLEARSSAALLRSVLKGRPIRASRRRMKPRRCGSPGGATLVLAVGDRRSEGQDRGATESAGACRRSRTMRCAARCRDRTAAPAAGLRVAASGAEALHGDGQPLRGTLELGALRGSGSRRRSCSRALDPFALEFMEAAELGRKATIRRCKPGRLVRTGGRLGDAQASGGAVAIVGDEGFFHELESRIGEGRHSAVTERSPPCDRSWSPAGAVAELDVFGQRSSGYVERRAR